MIRIMKPREYIFEEEKEPDIRSTKIKQPHI
jgi:hypothetical protein